MTKNKNKNKRIKYDFSELLLMLDKKETISNNLLDKKSFSKEELDDFIRTTNNDFELKYNSPNFSGYSVYSVSEYNDPNIYDDKETYNNFKQIKLEKAEPKNQYYKPRIGCYIN